MPLPNSSPKLSSDPEVQRAFEMLGPSVLATIKAVGVMHTLAGLSNHLANMLHTMHKGGKIDVDSAVETIRAVAKSGVGSVSFKTLNG